MSGQHLENYDVIRKTVHYNPRNVDAVARDQRWPDVVAGISVRFSKFASALFCYVGGVVSPWLVRSASERAFRVRALTGDIVLCSWARHFTLTVPLSTQVYKCMVPANCWGIGVT